MKFLVFLLLVFKLFAYELYIKKKSDLLIVNNLGIECEQRSFGYLCEKSKDLGKVLKLKNYLLNFGVKSYILDEEAEAIKNGYCIQIVSSKKLEPLKKEFTNLKSYPYARIEKIGSYFVIRVGEDKNKTALKKIYSKINRKYKEAFIRKCDYIPSRIIFPAIKVVKKKRFDFGKYSDKELDQIMYKAYLNGDLELAKEIANKLKGTLYKKDALIIDALLLYKRGNLRKSCKVLEDLNDIYSDYLIQKHMKKVCYEYYIKNAEQQIYISPIRALFNIKKALKLKEDIRVRKDLALVYFNIREYNSAFNILKTLYYEVDDKNVANVYANTLFALNKFSELEKVCKKYPTLSFCTSYKEYKKAKFYYTQLKYDKAYIIAKKLYKLYPYSKNIKILFAKILNKKHRPDEAMLVIETIFDANEDVATIALLRDIFYNQDDINNAYKYAIILKEKGINNKKNSLIIHEYLLYKAYKEIQNKNYKKALEYTKEASKYLNSLDVLEMRAEIYYKMGNLKKALKFYKNIYLKEPNERIKRKLVDIYFELSEIDKAKEISSEDYFYLKYARLLLNKGEYVRANVALSRVEKPSFEFYKLRGITCFYLKNYKCAISALKKAHFDDEVNYYLILSYINLGDKQKAKELLKNFSNIDKRKISTIYIQLGDIKKAKEIMKDL